MHQCLLQAEKTQPAIHKKFATKKLLEASVRPERAGEAARALTEGGQALLAAVARGDGAALAAAGVADPSRWLRLWSRGAPSSL